MIIRRSALFLAVMVILAACSDDGGSVNPGPRVRMGAELAAGTVRGQAVTKGADVASEGETVDSLRVSRVRFLVKEIKLHRANTDTTTGDEKVKVGPVLVTVVSTGTTVFLTETVPVGSYDKVKLEFHRFSSSEVSQYINDPVFGDFAADDRYSFIIEGTVYKAGVETPFVYRSTVTANLSLKFDNLVALSENSSTDVVLQVDTPLLFVQNSTVLNPRDDRNRSEIDKNIKNVIKAVKKAF